MRRFSQQGSRGKASGSSDRSSFLQFEGITYAESFRLDLLVEGQLIFEVKSTERNLPVYSKQLLTYLRLIEQPVGLLMNFGYPTFREGLKRVVNGPADLKSANA
jgi:GxxExxY protein